MGHIASLLLKDRQGEAVGSKNHERVDPSLSEAKGLVVLGSTDFQLAIAVGSTQLQNEVSVGIENCMRSEQKH